MDASYEKRVDWYRRARFGMFIHWGLYAIPARGEWVRSVERISKEDYQPYFDQFNRTRFDPAKWAKLCKKAGMQYAVMTAKHHDGFCLFDSGLTEYKATNTKAGRDLIRAYVEAFRAEGIKVGLYYSLIDWHHPDFPHYGDRQHPLRGCESEKEKEAGRDFNRYLEYMHGQVRELCVGYGQIDIFWFDFSYDNMSGEKWRAAELIRMVRGLQPQALIDNRLEASGSGFGSLLSGNPSEYSGDFVSPEQIIPPEGILDVNGNPVVWEACITLNNNWGYTEYDREWKSAATVIRKLVECVSKGGNLLLNVGPDARGQIPKASVQILEEVGEWMEGNGESIYGAGVSGIPKPPWGYVTENAANVYLHVCEQTVGPVPLHEKREDYGMIQLLASGAEIQIIPTWTTHNYPDYMFIPLGPVPFHTYTLPDERNTVIRMEKKGHKG